MAQTMPRPLTKPQAKMLTKAMRDSVYPYRQSYRPAYYLMEVGLLAGDFKDGLRITPLGMRALRDYRAARWADVGCMTNLDNLKEVDAALATMPATATGA